MTEIQQKQEAEQPSSGSSAGGDPLAAMYVLAALFMGVAAIVIVALIFVPPDLFDPEPTDVWVPGSGPSWNDGQALRASLAPPGVTQTGPNQYTVVVAAYNWEFEPREIRLPVGAEVTFRARSDQDYHGFAIINTPVILSLEQFESKEANWRFEEPGEYMIVCSAYCGGGHGTMQSRIIVSEEGAEDSRS